MKRTTILGLCLVAVFAVAGMLASAASAALPAPAWAVCAKAPKVNKKFTGKWEKGCAAENIAGEGKYEITEGVGKAKAFKGKTGPTRLDVQSPFGDDAVACESGKGSSKPAAPNRMQALTVTFKGCELSLFGSKTEDPCFTAGAKKENEITIAGVGGELGYIEEAPSVRVGVRLESEAEAKGVMVEFNCAYKVSGEHPNHELIIKNGKVANQMIGELKGFSGGANKESELVLEGKEQYGEHEFEGKKYKPIVNYVGWAEEVEKIDECAGQECATEHPAHVLLGEFCGPFVEGALHKECTPPAYSGLTSTTKNKGEALMIKT